MKCTRRLYSVVAVGLAIIGTQARAASGGALAGTADSLTAAGSLTTEGTADWVHFSPAGTDRKAGVQAQVSNYFVLAGGSAQSYANDLRSLSWNDGSPTGASTKNANGLFLNTMSSGFGMTAPADTSQRTINVHVGGWNSGGTLTAHLSDGSASDYVDVAPVSGSQYDRNYSLTYQAASAGQTLTVSWKLSTGPGNVTISGAALSGGSVVAPGNNVRSSAGTPQSATVNAPFATALQATVTDSNGNPVSGATVSFGAPTSGASGTFAGASSATALTTSAGVATAPAFTANSTAGSYTVTANVSGGASSGVFSMINTATSQGTIGLLSGSGDGVTTSASLTSEGGIDWVHFGDSALQRKNGGAAVISTYSVVGGGAVSTYGNDPRAINWTDGATTGANSSDLNGLYIAGAGKGFSVSAPADATSRTLTVHVGGWNSSGTFRAHLSDGSAADFVDSPAGAGAQYDRNYHLSYHAASAGQTLTVTWQMASGSGNVTLSGVALDGPATTGSLAVNLNGLPAGSSPGVVVTGPGGYTQTINSSQTLARLAPGTYQIAATAYTYSGADFAPTIANQTATVTVGATTTSTVNYTASSGSLALTISGLPNGSPGNVQVTGPGLSVTMTASQTIGHLQAGSYTINATNVVANSLTYAATPASQTATVVNGSVAGATVGYSNGVSGSPGCGLAGKQTGDFHLTTTDGNGATRDYEVMVPAGYNPNAQYPLTFVYHGLNGNEGVAKSYGIQSASGATAGGIFVFPLSADPSGNTWVDSCGGKDVHFFDNMLTAIEDTYCVNTNRVYVAGFSWGCDQATGLVSCRGDRIRAASVASCTYEFGNASDYRTYHNLPTPVKVNTATRFTHDVNGDQFYNLAEFTSTSALLRSFNSCTSSSTPISPNPCVSYGSCTNPTIECSYAGLGHAIPAGWGTDTWNFFNGFQ